MQPTTWIALYGAILASGTFLWTLYRDAFRDRAKLEIYPSIMNYYGLQTERDVLTVRVTNIGGKPITLTHLGFAFAGTTHAVLNVPEIPKKFESGAYHIYLTREYTGLQKADIRKMYACDSVGRYYYAPRKHLKKLLFDLKRLSDAGVHAAWVEKETTS